MTTRRFCDQQINPGKTGQKFFKQKEKDKRKLKHQKAKEKIGMEYIKLVNSICYTLKSLYNMI